MTKRVLFLVLILAAAHHAPLASARTAGESEVKDPESYAVYSAVLPAQIRRAFREGATVLIQTETSIWPPPGEIRPCMPSAGSLESVWRPVLDGLLRQSAKPQKLFRRFQIDRRYTVKPAKSWNMNAGGILVLSPVAFDESRTRAIVSVDHFCGVDCGNGGFHFLEKRDGRWLETTPPGAITCSWIT